jgi:hypothetical protein
MGEAHTIFSFLLLFSFAKTLIHIAFQVDAGITFWAIFVRPKGSGNWLCRGTTNQEYFRTP